MFATIGITHTDKTDKVVCRYFVIHDVADGLSPKVFVDVFYALRKD
jgi:hypothetical protein